MADVMPERQRRLVDIVDALRGTCQSVDHVLDTGEDAMDADICEAIDAELFECETCGWWCEWSEESERVSGSCTDCIEEGEEDD